MSFYHWFSSHPNEIDLSGDIRKMQDIAKELRITDAKKTERPKQTDFRRISSVPDIWSQHRLFEMLLLNKAEDPSYLEYEAIAKREWRAMIAILVLAESYGIAIKTETIRFSAPVNSRYLSAAYSTRPNYKHWPSMDVYYIEADEERFPIAMSSPTVHIIPTKDAWRNLRMVYEGKIPWLTENQVFAPVVDDTGLSAPFMLGEREAEKVPAMMPVHALLLQRWLAKYRETLVAQQRREGNVQQLLNIPLIASYEQALSDAFRLKTDRMPNMDSFFASDEKQVAMRIGDVRVPKNLKIFLDRAFYSTIDQGSTLPEILDTHRFAGGIAKECLVSKQQVDGKFAHFFVAMPVTQMFWRLWRDNEALNPAYTIKCVFSADGVFLNKITATIVIGDITFSRTYSIAQIDTEYWRNLCTAGIWPRQKIAGWKDYYLFCNEINGYELAPEEEVEPDKQRHYGKSEKTEGELSYYQLTEAPERCALRRKGRMIGYLEIKKRQVQPHGEEIKVLRASIDFGTSATTLYASVNGAKPRRISGVNLWSLPLVNTFDAEAHDTSRLEKYFFPVLPPKHVGGRSISRRTAPVAMSYDALRENDAELAEFPACVPMQTILADTRGPEIARSVFLDSWIYFRSFLQLRDGKEWPEMFSNLKWAHARANDQNRIQAILTEILLMIALEARSQNCGKIAITASYPLSFDNETRNTYFNALNAMLAKILVRTGLSIEKPEELSETETSPKRKKALIESITESEAVFRFSVRQDRTNENYFVIDIGGGSTDIFISFINGDHGRSSSATSLEFGARKVLIEKLLHNDETILKSLMTDFESGLRTIVLDPNNYIKGFAARNKSSMVEDLFSMRIGLDVDNPAAELQPTSFGEAFISKCAEGTDQKLFLELKKRIAFYLGASIWLSGMMLKGEDTAGAYISLLFTGNGSKMIRWLSPEIDRIRHYIYLLFNSAGDLGLPRDNFSIRFSAMPKEEVAFGSLLGLPDEFFEVGEMPPKQVTFDQAETQTDDFEAYSPVHYESKNIATRFDDFANFMRAYRKACKLSFGWEFEEGEYNESLMTTDGFASSIKANERKNRTSFFLNALEVISVQYMKAETENETK